MQEAPVFLGRYLKGLPPFRKVEPLSQIATDVRNGRLTDSNELVARVYYSLLGRPPDTTERQLYVNRLAQLGWGGGNMIAFIAMTRDLSLGATSELTGVPAPTGPCVTFRDDPHLPLIQYFTGPKEITSATIHYHPYSQGIGSAYIDGEIGYGEVNDSWQGYILHVIQALCAGYQDAEQKIVDEGSAIVNALASHSLTLPGSPVDRAMEVAFERRGIVPSGNPNAVSLDDIQNAPLKFSTKFRIPKQGGDDWGTLYRFMAYIATSVGLDNFPNPNPFSWPIWTWFGPAQGTIDVELSGITSPAVTFFGNIVQNPMNLNASKMTLPVRQLGIDVGL